MSGWISVSDRLPEDSLDGVAVIVATHSSSGKYFSETDAWCKQRKNFDYWGSKVTHWQPLPSPPPEQTA